MSATSEAVTNFRRRRKANLVKVLGSKCSLCGYDNCIGALEFHHIEPESKSYQLSAGNCHSLEEDLEEAKKCLLVCANCHREIHTTDKYDGVNLFDYQNFDFQMAQDLLDELKPTERKCYQCGASITRKSQSGLCEACANKARRKTERPLREELKKLIRTTSFVEIGRQFSVSDNAIRKWCDAYNLPRRKDDIAKYTDAEWEKI